MQMFSRHVLVIMPIAFIFICAVVFLPRILLFISNFVSGSEEVEFIEVKELYDNEKSIEFKSTREGRFLSGIFGDTIINEVYITDEDGYTESIPLNKIVFEIGDSWNIKRSGVQQIHKDGSTGYVNIDTYTIIATKDEIIELSSDFTKTFRTEFEIDEN